MSLYAARMRVALAAVLLAWIMPLAAQTRDEASQSLFRKLDSNRDGALSSAELASRAAREESWIAIDRNRDGRISASEFTAVRAVAGAPSSGAAGATRPSAPAPTASGRP